MSAHKPEPTAWVNCEDRLPTNENEVVAYRVGAHMIVIAYYSDGVNSRWPAGRWIQMSQGDGSGWCESDITDGVTHWLPLPEWP